MHPKSLPTVYSLHGLLFNSNLIQTLRRVWNKMRKTQNGGMPRWTVSTSILLQLAPSLSYTPALRRRALVRQLRMLQRASLKTSRRPSDSLRWSREIPSWKCCCHSPLFFTSNAVSHSSHPSVSVHQLTSQAFMLPNVMNYAVAFGFFKLVRRKRREGEYAAPFLTILFTVRLLLPWWVLATTVGDKTSSPSTANMPLLLSVNYSPRLPF